MSDYTMKPKLLFANFSVYYSLNFVEAIGGLVVYKLNNSPTITLRLCIRTSFVYIPVILCTRYGLA